MRRFGYLLTLLICVVFWLVLRTQHNSLVHPEASKPLGHPVASLGEIFKGH